MASRAGDAIAVAILAVALCLYARTICVQAPGSSPVSIAVRPVSSVDAPAFAGSESTPSFEYIDQFIRRT